MATNTFKNKITANIGTSLSEVVVSPENTVTTVIGLSLANITTEDNIKVTVKLLDDSEGSSVFLVKNAPLSAGGSLVVVGGDQKLVLEAEDSIQVQSNTANSIDVTVSMLQIS